MKKIVKMMCALLLSVVAFSGCSCNKGDSKAALGIGDVNATTYETISLEYVDQKVRNKDSFVLYIYSATCTDCINFKPIIEEVIQEKDLIIYAVLGKNIPSSHALAGLATTPSLVVYSKGEVVFKTLFKDNKYYFTEKRGFEEFLSKYTYAPTMYYINLEQLDAKIENDEKFVIYYSRSSCGDCSYLNNNYLKTYLNNNHNTKKFYIIETDVEGIRYYKGEEPVENGTADQQAAYAQWVNFKNTYGLSNVNNPLGHGVGYVPTIQYYEDGEVKDMLVYFNDHSYSKVDGVYYVTIDSSYYDDNPYIGETMKLSDYQDTLSSFYNAKVKTFLDTNLSKVD